MVTKGRIGADREQTVARELIALLLAAGLGLILTWPIGMVWAAMAANGYNSKLLARSA